MQRLLPVTLLALLFAALIALMVLGWKRRGARQSQQLPAPEPDEDLRDLAGGIDVGPLETVYVSTVLADQPLERVIAHGLGARSRALLTRGLDGSWRIQREGAPSFTIHGDQVLDLTSASGMAGKAVGGAGLFVIRWQHGPDATRLDTGFRMAHQADHDLLLSRKEHA